MVTARDLQQRAETFAVDVVRMSRDLPSAHEIRNIRDQLSRSATGMAANYRASCRARSRAEFVAKLGIVVEEADETHMWLGMLLKLDAGSRLDVERLYQEADELTAIFTASRRTALRGKSRNT